MQSDVIRKNVPECCPVLIDDAQDLEKCEDTIPDAIKKCEGVIPNIRFRGFEGEWERRKFSDIADTRRGLTYKPNSIVDNGVRVLRSSNINEDTFVFGNDDVFVDENAVNIPYIQNGDILITSANGSSRLVGKHAIIRNLSDDSAVHGGFMLIASSSNPEFLNASMSSQWYSQFVSLYVSGGNGAIGNLNKNDLDTQIVLVPSLAEQQQIGTYFRNLDHLITLHQRKCDETKELKKYMLQKMFPRDGEKVPEIRLQGFTGEWEECKFGEFYEVNNERNKDLIGYDKTFSIATMTYKDEGNGAADSSLKTYKVLRIGDIAFEGHTNKEFRYGRFVANDVGDGIISPRFSTLRPINEMPVSFWKHYIHYEPVMRKKLVCSTKAGTMMNELVTSDFFEQEIAVPCIEEQRQIGTFLNYLDNLITLHQRKRDELKELKQYMLQNMFPQKI